MVSTNPYIKNTNLRPLDFGGYCKQSRASPRYSFAIVSRPPSLSLGRSFIKGAVMGDWFQSVVDRDATESEAPQSGILIQQWLVDEGIISRNASACVLGSDTGYPPGPNYEKAVGGHDDCLNLLATNGLNIITTRNVFHTGQGGCELVCAACTERFEATDAWGDAVGEWYERNGPGSLACPGCGHSQPIDEWEHDPPWGFANLGFEFWNWPPLTEQFVQQFAERLKHRVLLVAGKL